MIFTDLIGIIIFLPITIFVMFYGVIAIYRIFDNTI